jgi:penicillin amidase
MKLLAKIIGYPLGVVLALLIVIAITLWILGLMSVPDKEGAVVLPGLDAEVTVLLDAKGIPTIRAGTMRDAYRALGYLHARDRLWQMETTRRVGAGRMSEIIGSTIISFDILMRELNFYARAEAHAASLPDAERADLQAYADGVNAFLETRDRPLPIEFQMTLHEPEPWTVPDSLVWGGLMSLQLSSDAFREARNAAVVDLLGPERAAEFSPDNAAAPTTMNAGNRDAWIADYDASNAWILSGDRTASGMPILANDPHLGLRMPGTWYLARIETPDLTLVGATAPGVPLHVLGHNGRIAWGLTTTHADNQDAVPLDRETYEAATIRRERIDVRFGDTVDFEVRETPFGPVVSRLGETATAMSWTGLTAEHSTASALYRLNRARNWDEFLEAMALFHDPVQNVFYADVEGRIGMKVVGRLPVRAAGVNGSLPLSSSDPRAAWLGEIAATELPGLVDPANGMIANANNRVIDETYPHVISADYEAGYRMDRLLEELARLDNDHTPAQSAALQTDILAADARQLTPLFLTTTPSDAQAAAALATLEGWDFRMDRDAAAPALYSAMLNELVRVLAEDDLGELFEEAWRANPGFVHGALTEAPHWCDDQRTNPVEGCERALTVALDRAVAKLSEDLGDDPASWRWGALHTAPMRNIPLSFVPVLSSLVDRPIETSGGDHTLARGQSRGGGGGAPFAHVHGAGFRAVYDLSNLDESLFALAGGQSGNPFADGYGALLEDWRDGRYFMIPGRAGDIPVPGGSLLRFNP